MQIFLEIRRIYLKLMKKNQNITTCNQPDLKTLGFWLIMPINLLGHQDIHNTQGGKQIGEGKGETIDY